jgi:ATP-dependent DNA helicase RecQ
MPHLKTIICLANSRKHGERCIAGIEVETGRWVRPVSGLDDGRVPRARQLINGKDVKLLDLIRIPLAETGPDFGFESENLSLLPGEWSLAGAAAPPDLTQYCSKAPQILHNNDSHVSLPTLRALPKETRQTLELVETTKFSVENKGPSAGGGHKWEGTIFTTGGASLTAKITDPIYVERLESGHRPADRCLVTVSLGMPYRPEQWPEDQGPACWKLIAGVVELEEGGHTTTALVDRGFPEKSHPGGSAPTRFVAIDSDRLRQSLKTLFGYETFRSHQEEIIRAILEGRDAFAVMPTGSGKSLCYQIPAHLLDGCCVVVSPLISLMKDQVDAACQNGLRAASINSSQSDGERIAALQALSHGQLDLLYAAPERIATDAFLNVLKRSNLCLFAIDEAHCISEWGHDFRPDYLFLSNLRVQFPNIPIAAFTATATEEVERDTLRKLRLSQPYQVRASFDRPNLFYRVVSKQGLDDQILEFIRARTGEAGIVYRATRKSVASTAELLSKQGVKCLPYHAGLSSVERNRNQEAFNRDEVEIIVATIAFGMGIDKPNVRFVLHGDLPKNIENYYQETGRAGRDGLPAECVLFFSRGDVFKVRHFIDQIEDVEQRDIALEKLRQMVSYGSVNRCRRAQLLAYFSEEYAHENCRTCDVCCGTYRMTDVTSDACLVIKTILDTRQRFGAGHIVDVLCGAKTKKIKGYKHSALSTFGAGKDKGKEYFRQLIEELLSRGFLTRAEGLYPTLEATSEGRKILTGARSFSIRAAQSVKDIPAQIETVDFDRNLFEKLRQLRKMVASELSIPPYMVFHDRTLQAMSQRKPLSPQEMQRLYGVGERKFTKFGNRFLDVIRQHPSVAGIVKAAPSDAHEDPVEERPSSVEKTRKDHAKASAPWNENEVQLLKAGYLRGRSIATLAKALGRNEGAVRWRLKKLGLIG